MTPVCTVFGSNLQTDRLLPVLNLFFKNISQFSLDEFINSAIPVKADCAVVFPDLAVTEQLRERLFHLSRNNDPGLILLLSSTPAESEGLWPQPKVARLDSGRPEQVYQLLKSFFTEQPDASLNPEGTPDQFYRHNYHTLLARVLPGIDRPLPVLICGETGSGKNYLARYIHNQSNRKPFPFYVINCAAIPDQLLESELFGHEEGAFTGAWQKKDGRFTAAGSGTLVLDEIGEMTLRMQAKLLQVLDEYCYTPVGGQVALPLRARIIATTNIDLQEAVTRGRFRKDLFYRLNIIPITLPPLRQLPNLIYDYFMFFLRKHSFNQPPALHKDLKSILENYAWPGNIREIENLAQRIVISGLKLVSPQDLSGFWQKAETSSFDMYQGGEASLEAIKSHYAQFVYRKLGSQKLAARKLRVDAKTLRKLLRIK